VPESQQKKRKRDRRTSADEALIERVGSVLSVPLEYLYGLKRIEILPRASELVGVPFGTHRNRRGESIDQAGP
jgi:hypothetical protein